ncbi:MAG: sulfotransferase [Bacteroidota bacterium]
MNTPIQKGQAIHSSKAGYGNFKDPTGLLVRMLKSGKKAAYFTLIREGFSIMLKPLDWIFSPLEKKRLRKGLTSDLPLILILGGSRSGTTLLYQTLAGYLPVSYFNNLSAAFSKSPITGGMLFNRLLRKKKGDFKNYYGSVAGFNGPNDGFHIWNRWFGMDRNHIPEDIPEATLKDLENFVSTWNASFKKPLLNKNNRNSICIAAFEKALPNQVYYVVIKRNPVYVIQSLIQSREVVQGDKRVAWGLEVNGEKANATNLDDPYAYVDEISEQVFAVNDFLREELKQVDPNRYVEISYEAFCKYPQDIVQNISQLIFGKEISPKNLKGLKPFRNTNSQKLGDEEFARIKNTVASKHVKEKRLQVEGDEEVDRKVPR